MRMYAGHFDFTQRLLWTVPALFSPPSARVRSGVKMVLRSDVLYRLEG